MLLLKITAWVTRIAGVITLLLGLAIWIFNFSSVELHMTFGTLFALSVLITSIVLVTRKGGRVLGLIGIVYAFVLPAFGMAQLQLVTAVGGYFWIIRVVHLLLGLGAMGLAQGMLGRYNKLTVKPASVSSASGVESLVR